MILRREQPKDRDAIFAVHTAAFVRDGAINTAEARLVDDLRADGDAIPSLSLVAMVGQDVVGHVLCSRGSIDGRPLPGLGPLGVLPNHQRRGFGQALIHGILAAADALDEQAVVLLGDPSYYNQFGFVLAEHLGLLPPDPSWSEHFQVRPLTSWDGSLRGTYQYPEAFDRL